MTGGHDGVSTSDASLFSRSLCQRERDWRPAVLGDGHLDAFLSRCCAERWRKCTKHVLPAAGPTSAPSRPTERMKRSERMERVLVTRRATVFLQKPGTDKKQTDTWLSDTPGTLHGVVICNHTH
ncbi:hypothetical protein EYF80_027078 [Liparis tanakae]|uniref:Uncharacterized protein n=1 Tax=Liparis tanakae TaxID=230148 RepID=A0A4Z2HAE8_9TELE|nr:hypothetical protein EYF80_027078 [Liparis tanakae]